MINEGDLKALYPFLHGSQQEPAKLEAALFHSIEEKARDSRETNARFFGEQAPALVAVAKTVANVYRKGGRLFSMGNGGSGREPSHTFVESVYPLTPRQPAVAPIHLSCDIALLS